MPRCRNCGNMVSERYEQVKTDDELDGVPACPECEDAKIEDGEKYEYR